LPLSAFDSREGWKLIAAPKTLPSFGGDAVLSNGRVAAVIRQGGSTVDIYGMDTGKAMLRSQLRLLAAGGEPVKQLERLALSENSRAASSLEATYKTAEGISATARFRLKRGEVALQVEPGAGAKRLRVECPARFVILPDFFADDIVIDARGVSPERAELPSENFLLHLTGNGDALVLSVFENRQHDVQINLAGAGAQRAVQYSELAFEGKKVWLAVIEGAQVWHVHELQAADAGKILPLDWKMPFPAQWRLNFTRPNGLADSWEMLLQRAKGQGYIKPSWLGAGSDQLGPTRRRWNTVLGDYFYPCWSDAQGRGFLQPLKNEALLFKGPVAIYPINRVEQTPLDAYTVVDVMRNTLGVGPCEYILDLEGQKAEYKGRATCSCRDELGAIYGKNHQKEEHAKVEQVLDDGLIFVKHIRSRIERYVEFGHKMRDYLAAQKKLHPELADSLGELDKIAREIDERTARRADKIQTPAHVAAMNADFRKNVLNDYGPDALAKCKEYTAALVVIGDNQDELSGECRWVAKALRQKAGLLMAQDPRVAAIASEIRLRTQEVLRNPATHEGAHH
jgi:hypothetical protein